MKDEIVIDGITYYANKTEIPVISNSLTAELIGKYVIVRSRNEGVNFGKLKHADETGCVITKARRLWQCRTEKGEEAWYEGVSKIGLAKNASISPTVAMKIIVEDYSLTICEDKAIQEIKNHAATVTSKE